MVVITVNNPDLVLLYLIVLILSNFCLCTYTMYSALYIVDTWKKSSRKVGPQSSKLKQSITYSLLSASVCIILLGLHSLVVKTDVTEDIDQPSRHLMLLETRLKPLKP